MGDSPIKDDLVLCPIGKGLVIVDENGEFLFATSAKHVIQGLREHETICDYLANYEVPTTDYSQVSIGPAHIQGG